MPNGSMFNLRGPKNGTGTVRTSGTGPRLLDRLQQQPDSVIIDQEQKARSENTR
jgi:hypothetical protein